MSSLYCCQLLYCSLRVHLSVFMWIYCIGRQWVNILSPLHCVSYCSVVSSLFDCNWSHVFVKPHVIVCAAIVASCRFESQSVFECRRYKMYGSLLIGMFTSSLRFCILSLLISLCIFFLRDLSERGFYVYLSQAHVLVFLFAETLFYSFQWTAFKHIRVPINGYHQSFTQVLYQVTATFNILSQCSNY